MMTSTNVLGCRHSCPQMHSAGRLKAGGTCRHTLCNFISILSFLSLAPWATAPPGGTLPGVLICHLFPAPGPQASKPTGHFSEEVPPSGQHGTAPFLPSTFCLARWAPASMHRVSLTRKTGPPDFLRQVTSLSAQDCKRPLYICSVCCPHKAGSSWKLRPPPHHGPWCLAQGRSLPRPLSISLAAEFCQW